MKNIPVIKSVPAIREEQNIFMLLYGTGGTGKTFTALQMALYLTGGDGTKIILADTDSRRSLAFAPKSLTDNDGIPFRGVFLDSFSPEEFIGVIHGAETEQKKVLIVDSMTSFWSGKNGLLDRNKIIANKSFGGNTRYSWAETNIWQYAMFAAMDHFLNYFGHVILCCEEREDTIQTANGREITEVGPDWRNKLGHRVNVSGRMTINDDGDNVMTIEKSTAVRLTVDGVKISHEPIMKAGTEFVNPGAGVVEKLLDHLHTAAAANREKEIEDYLSSLDTMDKAELLHEYQSVVPGKAWPADIKQDVLDQIKARGKALAETAATPDWQARIADCASVEEVQNVQDELVKVNMLEAYKPALHTKLQQLGATDSVTA